jgi:hypothetical protein
VNYSKWNIVPEISPVDWIYLFVSLADGIVTVTACAIFSYIFTKHERVLTSQNSQLFHWIRVVLQANKQTNKLTNEHTYIHKHTCKILQV